MKKILVLALAWLSVLAGIAGVVLPFLPGIPLLLLGLVLLARHYPWAGRLLQKIRRKLRDVRQRYSNRIFI